jgi:endonuclease/exonuclease/phosphatase family metal-dependent hydrolase
LTTSNYTSLFLLLFQSTQTKYTYTHVHTHLHVFHCIFFFKKKQTKGCISTEEVSPMTSSFVTKQGSKKNQQAITICTYDSGTKVRQYLAPFPVDEHTPLEVVGIVGLQPTPFTWVRDTASFRLSTPDGRATWDFVKNPEDGDPVYLYNHVTLSHRQDFDTVLGTGTHTLGRRTFTTKQNVLVTCTQGSLFPVHVHAWTVATVPPVEPALPPVTWCGSEQVTLTSDTEVPVRVTMACNADPGGVFRYPVFFHKCARLSIHQRKEQPVLVIHATDWTRIQRPDVTHEGAFGHDFAVWSVEKVHQAYVPSDYDLRGSQWVVVWKFPSDLNRLDGYRAVYRVPLPVGSYPFVNDNWSTAVYPAHTMDTKLRAAVQQDARFEMVQKIRYDLPGTDSVHHLESESGVQVAMASSHYMIQDFWRVTPVEKQQVVRFLTALWTEAQVYAFPCYTQHHAIVFYLDDSTGKRLTPRRMASLLADMVRGPPIHRVLETYFGPKRAQQWIRAYTSMYGSNSPLRILSYNLAYNNVPENVFCIATHICNTQPDVVCLQEVTAQWVELLEKYLGDSYIYATGPVVSTHHDVGIWIRKDAQEVKFSVYRLRHHDRRSLVVATCVLHGRNVAIATAHLQSSFFTQEATATKAVQLRQVADALTQASSQSNTGLAPESCFKVYAGDTNLTGNHLLAQENKAIKDAGFVDVWPSTTPAFDRKELQDDVTFQRRDATWCSPENKTIFDLQKTSYIEHHRPDRVLLEKRTAKRYLYRASMDIIRTEWSDHYGVSFAIA